jgi:hypothetical protein
VVFDQTKPNTRNTRQAAIAELRLRQVHDFATVRDDGKCICGVVVVVEVTAVVAVVAVAVLGDKTTPCSYNSAVCTEQKSKYSDRAAGSFLSRWLSSSRSRCDKVPSKQAVNNSRNGSSVSIACGAPLFMVLPT